MDALLTPGQVAARSGLTVASLHHYESLGLITAERTTGGQRRYRRDVLRRLAFVVAAQRVGLSLAEIKAALETLPGGRAPTRTDWARLARSLRAGLDERIAALERLRDDLSSCIGCGCLSLQRCRLYNPEDEAAAQGPGARWMRDGPTGA